MSKMSVFLLAIHNWHGNVQHGIAIDVGDTVEILEECAQWYRGTSSRKPRSVGIFPKSYIRLKDPSKSDPVVTECTQVLREWSEIWKKLYVVSKFDSKQCNLSNIFKCFFYYFAESRFVQVFNFAKSNAFITRAST